MGLPPTGCCPFTGSQYSLTIETHPHCVPGHPSCVGLLGARTSPSSQVPSQLPGWASFRMTYEPKVAPREVLQIARVCFHRAWLTQRAPGNQVNESGPLDLLQILQRHCGWQIGAGKQ